MTSRHSVFSGFRSCAPRFLTRIAPAALALLSLTNAARPTLAAPAPAPASLAPESAQPNGRADDKPDNKPGAATGPLRLNVNARGFQSLRYNGIDLLGPTGTTQTSVKVRDANGVGEWASNANAAFSFDAASATQTVQYGWGRASYRYAVQGDRLLVTTTVLNQSARTIVDVYCRPLNLAVASGLQSPGAQGSPRNIDDVAIVRREFAAPDGGPGAALFLVSEDIDPTLTLRIGAPYKQGAAQVYGLEWLPTQQKASDNVHADTADIGPRQSKSYKFSLRFRPQSETLDSFSNPLYAERGEQVGTLLNWSDRRPIGSIFMANSDTRWPNNPRGWFNDSSVDINAPAERAKLQERMMKFADGCVKNLKNVGAQGMLLWDVEGEEMPHAITYLGDPRVLPQAAPEMDEVADKFFAKFRKAGLRTGITIRPSRVVTDAKTGKWRHNQMDFDVVGDMSDKINYAQNRWGCTMFYVDSNATYAFDIDNKVTSWIMRAEMFRELQRRHPDCLLIPEHNTFDYWSATAPYDELRSNHFGTPDLARVAYPGAFSVINIAEGDLTRHHDALVEDIRNGDVLLFRCWFDDKTHAPVQQLYAQAATPKVAPAPAPQPEPKPKPTFESEIIVDNRDAGATYEGAWKASGASDGFYAQDYQHDGNGDKGQKSARFAPDLPRAGTWQVFARWSSFNNRATNAPFDVNAADATASKPSATLVLNQRQNGGEWVSLGQYFFQAGSDGDVTLRTGGTNGYVIADAIKWVFVSASAPANPPANPLSASPSQSSLAASDAPSVSAS